MANEIYIGPQVVFGNQDVDISATPISTTNTANIIKVDENGYTQYNPNDGSIPQFTAIETGAGYIYNSKTVQNLPAFFKLGAIASVVSTIVNDLFTGSAANLTAHTPDTGTAPLKGWSATGNLALVGDGTMTSTAAAGTVSRYYYPNNASGANQKVTARIKFTGTSGGTSDTQIVVLSLRADETTSDITSYILIISGANIGGGPGRYRLTITSVVNGVTASSPIATLADVAALIDGSFHDISFEVTGSAFNVKVDGTSVLTATDSGNALPGGSTQRKAAISTLGSATTLVWVFDSFKFENI